MSQGLSTTDVDRHPARKQQSTEGKETRSRRKRRRKLSPPVILVLGLTVPFAQSTQATELQYARAIGHEFLPEAPKARAPADDAGTRPADQLPQLGGAEPNRQAEEEASGNSWTKILVGVVVVGAIAALANRGGGGGGEDPGTATTASDSPDPGSGSESSGSGTGIGIGGGGITITSGGRKERGRGD